MLQLIGGLIIALGIFLFLGNITGYFPTFSGAGWLGIFVGGLLFKAGARQNDWE